MVGLVVCNLSAPVQVGGMIGVMVGCGVVKLAVF